MFGPDLPVADRLSITRPVPSHRNRATSTMDTMVLPAVGTRISLSGSRGTVRFTGYVDNKGVWLGVEWDDPDRGKHNGVKDGKQYFECRYVVPSECAAHHSQLPSQVYLMQGLLFGRPRPFVTVFRFCMP